MSVYIEWETENPFEFDENELSERIAEAVLEAEGCPYEAEVNIVVTDNNGIQEINRECRSVDAPTDVLSFPVLEYDRPGDFSFLDENADYFDPDSGELLLGDIMLSLERVLSQAEEYGHSVYREFSFLLVHSLLHLCGYDHMEAEERAVMEERQRVILEQLGISRQDSFL